MRRAAFLMTMLLTAACGQPPGVTDAGPVATGGSTTTSPSTTVTTAIPEATTSTTSTTEAAAEEVLALQVYFMSETVGETNREGPFLVPVYREVPQTEAVASAAVNQLLAGPGPDEASGTPAMSTAIPEGTVLLGMDIDNGLATVDLSREFESGGGSFSMAARLAQVVYTVTQFPTVERVQFHLDGHPVEVFSSEGLVMDSPVTRDNYLDLLPQIFVDRPAWGAPAASPVRVIGRAAVFEATFHMGLYDDDGEPLAEPPFVMTDEGMGWGDFDVTLEYSVDRGQVGALIVWDFSAEDGSRQNIREHPVRLFP